MHIEIIRLRKYDPLQIICIEYSVFNHWDGQTSFTGLMHGYSLGPWCLCQSCPLLLLRTHNNYPSWGISVTFGGSLYGPFCVSPVSCWNYALYSFQWLKHSTATKVWYHMLIQVDIFSTGLENHLAQYHRELLIAGAEGKLYSCCYLPLDLLVHFVILKK